MSAVILLLIALSGRSWSEAGARQTSSCDTGASRIESIHVSSALYGNAVNVSVYLPPCYDPEGPSRYPVIYLLHGGGADETQWLDLKVPIAADDLIAHGAPPFVVVMPGGAYSVDYGTFVIKELIPGIELHYRVQTIRSGRGIGGLSLGGYWALKIVFLHPDLFAVVGGYSPVVGLGYADDPLFLASQVSVEALQGLDIALDVGDRDSLLYDTNQLAQALRARGLGVQLTIGQGGHVREYWRAYTYDYLSFYVDAFNRQLVQQCKPPVGDKRLALRC